VENIALKN